MAIAPHSMNKELIARYESEQDADAAIRQARQRDSEGKFNYIKSYSPFAGKWLVAVHNGVGSRIGYLHHIID